MSREITSEEQAIIEAAVDRYTGCGGGNLMGLVERYLASKEEKTKKKRENPFELVPDDHLSGIYNIMKDGNCYFKGDEDEAEYTAYRLNQGYSQALKDVEKSKKESEEYHKDIKIDEHRGPGR